MSSKQLHNLVRIPLLLVGLMLIVLGASWLTVREPWLLDQAANEAALTISFKKLFSANINAHLPDYLRLVYRFFGWWVISMGILMLAYIQVTRLGTRLARNTILGVLGVILIGVYILEFKFIPGSPFVWLTHGVSLLWFISIWATITLRKADPWA